MSSSRNTNRCLLGTGASTYTPNTKEAKVGVLLESEFQTSLDITRPQLLREESKKEGKERRRGEKENRRRKE